MLPDHAPEGAPRRLGLVEAMASARRALTLFTDLPVDSVVSCAAAGEGWLAVLDVIEAPARLGDNDLLATYEVSMAADGEVTGFKRLRRYHREDKEPT